MLLAVRKCKARQSGKMKLTMEFFLNVFTEFSDKNIVIIVKGLKPATSCLRDQDATTVPARHMSEPGSLN